MYSHHCTSSVESINVATHLTGSCYPSIKNTTTGKYKPLYDLVQSNSRIVSNASQLVSCCTVYGELDNTMIMLYYSACNGGSDKCG